LALDNDENPQIMKCAWKGNTKNPSKIFMPLHGNTFKFETANPVFNMFDVTANEKDVLIIAPISP